LATAKKRGRTPPPQSRRGPRAPIPPAERLRAELAEARAQQAATAEILKLIARSPADSQPVFDCIVKYSSRLCKAPMATVILLRGGMLHLASSSLNARRMNRYNKLWPMPLARSGVQGVVVRDKKLANVKDVTSDKRVAKWARPLYRAMNIRSGLWVPMLRKREVIGLVAAFSPEADGFVPIREKLLKTFADQAVIAIENARRFNEANQALERQTVTGEVLRVIASSPSDVQPVLNAIVASAKWLVGGRTAAVHHLSDGKLHLAAFTPTTRAGDKAIRAAWPLALRDAGAYARAVRSREPCDIQDTEKAAASLRQAGRAMGYRSLIVVPMLKKDTVIGTVSVLRPMAGPFDVRQMSLLQTFSDQAVIAIENVRLFNETKESLERQTATSDVLVAISGAQTDVTPVFEAIARNAQRLCKAMVCNVLRLDGDMLHIAASHGFSPSQEKKLREKYPVRAGDQSVLSGRVVVSKQVELIDDIRSDPAYDHSHSNRIASWRRMLGVPMLCDDMPLGVIVVAWHDAGKTPEAEVSLLKTFAAQAAIAIENVRLFNDTKEALERQTATGEILSSMSNSMTDAQPVFDAIAQNVVRLLNSQNSTVQLLRDGKMHLVGYVGPDFDRFSPFFPQPVESSGIGAMALRERKVVQLAPIIGNPQAPKRSQELATSFNYNAIIGVPLMRDGAAIGALVTTRKDAIAFDDKQVSILQTFADQAVIAIENVRLFNETKESLERQTATAEILKVIASSPADVQPVFDAIVASAARLFGRKAALRLVEPDGLRRRAWTYGEDDGFHGAELMAIDRDNLVGRAVLDRKPVQMTDTRAPDAPAYARAHAHELNYRSVASAPLIRDGAAIGVISVSSPEPGALSDKQMELLATFADQAVIAIENVRLFNETKEALERQTATAEILQVIASSPSDIQPVFDAIVRSAVRLCGSLFGSVYRFDGEKLHFAAQHNFPAAALDEVKAKSPRLPDRGQGAGRAILTRSVSRIEDVAQDGEYRSAYGKSGGWRRVLTVPMMRDSTPLGAISVAWTEPGPIPESQVELLKTFADQAVIAIENVRLFNETKESLERQTATAEILRVISSSPDSVQPVFDTIARSAVRLCGSAIGGVFLRDGDLVRIASSEGFSLDEKAAVNAKYPVRIDDSSVISARTIASGAAIHIGDVKADSDYDKDHAEDGGWRRMFAVPMIRDGVALGSIVAAWRDPGITPVHQEELLKTFADQAVIAIENVRLFNETRESLERQTATAEILRVIASSPSNVQPVFDAIARSAKQLLGGHSASVRRMEDGVMRLAASTSTGGDGDSALRARPTVSLEQEGSVIGRAVKTRAPASVVDTDSKDYPRQMRELAQARGYRSLLAVPMLREGEPIGTIIVTRAYPGSFSEHQVDLLKTFADQAVIAIENVRLFNETKEALERQTATAEILKVIASSPADVQPVFDAIVQSAAGLFGRRANLRTVEAGALRRRAGGSAMTDEVLPIDGESLVGRIALEGRAIQVVDLLGPDAPPYAKQNAHKWDYRANAGAPLIRNGKAIGVITVTSPAPGALSDKQMALLTTFADQAVIAIENVRLFNETREALERQTATAEILKVIASSPADVQPVFDAIVNSALRLFSGHGVGILLVEEGNKVNLGSAGGIINLQEARKHYPIPLNRDTASGRAILDGHALNIADSLADGMPEPMKDLARAMGYRAIASAPLLREGVAIGALTVPRVSTIPLSEKELLLLQTFADQAVIAIENVRLFNETKEALERQTATADILKVISSSPTDTRPVFEAIVQSGLKLFSSARVGIGTVSGEEVVVEAEAGSGTSAQGIHMPLSRDSASGLAILERKVVNIPDIEAPGVPGQSQENARRLGVRSMTQAPMLLDGVPIGAIGVLLRAPGGLDVKQVSLLQTFASQAVIAIENVRLFKELQQRTEALTTSVGQLTALGEVGQAISSTLDLETVLQTIVSHAVKLAGLDGGSMYEYDEQAGEFRLQASENIDEALLKAVREAPVKKGEGAIGQTALTLEPVQIADIQAADYRGSRKKLLLKAGYRAILAVPLVREGNLLGALQVFRRTPGDFAPEVVELLKTFATQSAMAIQNARLFREIAEKGKQLEEASKHKSNFLASMSHELRTPLNAILGFNEMILGDIYGEVPADMKEPLTDIQTSGKHLLRLINNVLDLAKIEAGRMELALADYSVEDTVASVHATLRPLAAEKGLQFIAHVPTDLPLAHGDAGRISQCLMNLAGNSLKFTKLGSVEISVALREALLEYRITDTGIGIPPDKIGSLFTEFKQTDATIASEYGGTGLGLSISKQFIEMHGGRIWVESEVGKGSAFIFEVPLQAKAAS
jgi:GAF domain-containing protein